MKYHNLMDYRLMHTVGNSPFYEEDCPASSDVLYLVDVPSDWNTESDAVWRYCFPPSPILPNQGWKIHVSSCPAEASGVLNDVAELLVDRRAAFKHLVSRRRFLQSSSKNANRSSSGKFITVYPHDEIQFCELLQALEEVLAGKHGPYILSDVQYGQAPVYFRYGGFRYNAQMGEDGAPLLVIERPDGTYIEDVRAPKFVLPDFASIPVAVKDRVMRRLSPDMDLLNADLAPYVVQKSLHFSNGGGVYFARNNETGARVVLKEARPHAGYTTESEDAVSRLRRERETLLSLQGIKEVPRYFDYRIVRGHEFLVEGYMDGITLQSWVAANYPFSLEADKVSVYEESALSLARSVECLMGKVHDCGYALMDVNLKNFMVDVSLKVSLIDFEALCPLGQDRSHSLGTPGFMPLVACSNSDRDSFGMLSILFYLFWPSWTGSFSPGSFGNRLESIERFFSCDAVSYLQSRLNALPRLLLKSPYGFEPALVGEASCRGLIEGLLLGIEASRRMVGSDERRYPGDATQYLHGDMGMLDVETGAAGIMLMKFRAGCDVAADVAWIVSRLRALAVLPFHGLLRGVVGICSVLCQVGFEDEAMLILPSALPACASRDLSLRTGIAGTVMALASIASICDDEKPHRLLIEAVDVLKASIQDGSSLVSRGSETGNAIGLFDGWAGVALACKELRSLGVDDADLLHSLISLCLDRELKQLKRYDDGSLAVNYDGVDFGYLSEGSAGISFAISLCDPLRYEIELSGLRSGLVELSALNGGLFHGLAGKAAALIATGAEPEGALISLMMRNVYDGFLFAKPDMPGALFFLGDGGARLSCDYASGAAGLVGLLLSLDGWQNGWFPVPLH